MFFFQETFDSLNYLRPVEASIWRTLASRIILFHKTIDSIYPNRIEQATLTINCSKKKLMIIFHHYTFILNIPDEGCSKMLTRSKRIRTLLSIKPYFATIRYRLEPSPLKKLKLLFVDPSEMPETTITL